MHTQMLVLEATVIKLGTPLRCNGNTLVYANTDMHAERDAVHCIASINKNMNVNENVCGCVMSAQ